MEQIRARMMRPFVPSAVVTAEYAQIGRDDIPHAGLRIADDMRIAHTGSTDIRCQYRSPAVERNPAMGIVAVRHVQIDAFGVAVRIL